MDDLVQIVREVQRRRTELDNVEVKAARGGTPKRLYEPLSAFANSTGGGVLLFGLDEGADFKAVGVGNAQRLQEELTHLASNDMEPPLRPRFFVDEIDGNTVVAAEVDEVAPSQKPCYYKTSGLAKGSYLRVGNTNRQMTDYEVFGFVTSRGQPRDDEQLVIEAGLNDLDPQLLDAHLDNLRRARGSGGYLGGPRKEALVRLHICGADGATIRPTLAGLLIFGKYPQEFFPQLRITFVQYYGVTEEERTPKGERFLDNQAFEGSIAAMIQRAEAYIAGAMRKSALIDGLLRRDIPEYPHEALREALANAVAHRDYSSHARGSYIQVRMFADRLEIQSPGGLFGPVNEDNIEEEHSTRNVRLMRLMEDEHVVENRGSGIKAMIRSMHEANLEPPSFRDHRSSFRVTFRNHTLMNQEAISWLNQLAGQPLNDRQRLGLVYLRQHGYVTNSDYRRLNRVDSSTAGQELRGLVETGLAEQQGFGRGTSYRLLASQELPEQHEPATDEIRIVNFVREHGSITNEQCRELLGAEAHRVYYLLKKLSDAGRLKPSGRGRWRKYVLP